MEIALTQGKVALVDPEDYEWLSKFKWYAHKESNTLFYAVRKENTIRMHRVIIRACKGQEVDHINGNALDNRKSNLRIATHSQNMANCHKVWAKSGFRGVTWQKSGKKWQAQLASKYLGVFNTPEEAHERWKVAAKEAFGEFIPQ